MKSNKTPCICYTARVGAKPNPMVTFVPSPPFAVRWAGDLDVHDWRISPIFGDLKGLKHVTVFIGTDEVLYPDVTKMFRMLDPDISNELIVGEGMNHCYPLAPIEEAAPACNKVFHIVLRYLQASRVPVLSIFAFRSSVVGKDLGAAAE